MSCYQLVEIDGKARIKLSEDVEKVTLPGKKIAYRLYGQKGRCRKGLLTPVKGLLTPLVPSLFSLSCLSVECCMISNWSYFLKYRERYKHSETRLSENLMNECSTTQQ